MLGPVTNLLGGLRAAREYFEFEISPLCCQCACIFQQIGDPNLQVLGRSRMATGLPPFLAQF